MNKSAIVLASALALGAALSCTEDEALNLQPEYKYTDAYYEALRAYKNSDHSICYLWFADYGVPSSLAYRFAGIPDSVDVVSLWGGIPEKGSLDWKEMQEMREKKGTKVVGVKIIRLANTYYLPSWALDIQVPSYMNGYGNQKGYNDTYKETYDERIKAGDSETIAAAAAESAARMAGTQALIADMEANPSRKLKEGSTEENPEWIYPEWCEYAGNSILKEISDNDLDGYDLDYEPEGDALDGECMNTFIYYLAQYIGPMSPAPETILAVDGNWPEPQMAPYCTYHISQSYGQTIGNGHFNRQGWENSQLIFTENIGDDWKTGGYLEQQAAFQPSKGGRKGGFGAFHGQRDYNTTDSGADKEMPYGHLRRAIQLQNPAVTK
ncbi:MAG TPA: hypothetical protein DD383_01290 [Rikenellaceae bacterium]|nr:hypothetical protein [Rikenellaceae bacterium]